MRCLYSNLKQPGKKVYYTPVSFNLPKKLQINDPFHFSCVAWFVSSEGIYDS